MVTNIASTFDSLPDKTGLPNPNPTAPFDTLPHAAFIGVEFLAENIQIKGGLREHVHKYMQKPGGKVEKLGRELYTISMDCVFLVGHPDFPTGWPGDIGLLRSQFENMVTGDLVIPTVGTIQAHAFDWDETHSPKMRNGERMRVQWREDSDQAQIVSGPIVLQYNAVASQAGKFKQAAEDLGLTNPGDAIDSIFSLANEVQGLADQADLQADKLATKAAQLASVCRTFDALDKRLNDPVNHELVDALHDLGVAASNLNKDILRRVIPIGEFTVPVQMSVAQASTAIYGDTSHGAEIMKMNPLENPFAILPGTLLRYYLVPPIGKAA